MVPVDHFQQCMRLKRCLAKEFGLGVQCYNFYSMLHTGTILKNVEEFITNEDILNRYLSR